MATQRKSHVLRLGASLASVGWVVLVSISSTPRVDLLGASLCAAALSLAWIAARVKARPLAWACWGLGLVVASLIEGSAEPRWSALVGVVVASVAGIFGLTRVASLGGIVRDRARSPRMGLALLVATWLPTSIALVMQRSAAWSVAAAAALSLIVLAGVGGAARLERRLELGVTERLDAFLLLAAAALVLGGVAYAVSGAAPSACLGCALTGAAACTASTIGEPISLWRRVRRGMALVGLATVLASTFGLLVVEQRASERTLIAALALLGVVLGAELPRIARALRGVPSRRLSAAALASRALRGRDADQAVASALRAMQEAATPPTVATRARSPELWTLDPVRILRVDTAGYLHEETGELPPELVVIACGEPEATLRAEALAAVEIRRPDLRSLSRWMSDAKMATATLVARGGEIEAVLFLPTYDGIPELTLEEAHALRELADELAPLCHARARLARSMVREHQARTEADEAITRAERLEHQLERASAHHALAASRLARPAAVGIYSAQSRGAYEALERLSKAQAPIAVVAPSGVDPVPFLARAHLAGTRLEAPLVVVDCTSTREHDLERWRDPVASPLALADGGALVLLDAAALPVDVQRLVGQSLAERRAPWERADAVDIVLAITTTTHPRELAEQNRLDPLLASRLGTAIDDPVHLPRIADRPEDIRALVTDRLAREGLRVRGAPVGIDDAAFAVLVEHPFEGEDAELTAIASRLVARVAARGEEVVREGDIEAVLSQLVARAPSVISRWPETAK